MKIDKKSGLLDQAEFIASPNCDDRPENEPISLLVIHNISLPPNEFGGPHITELFTNQLNPDDHPFFQEIKDLRVSAHLLIRRNGDIIQYVPFNKRAWHAGVSSFGDRTQCNDFSIGIELEGADTVPYEPIQYQRLIETTQVILNTYPEIGINQIRGHCDIAPERKTDPGPAFDWAYYKGILEQQIS